MNTSRSDIPGARTLVADIKRIAQRGNPTPLDLQIIIAKCDDALAKMRRARWVTNAPPRSQRMRPELAGPIKEYHRLHYGMSQQAIGTHFGVSAGRVSEALTGQWDPGGDKYEAFVARNGKRKGQP